VSTAGGALCARVTPDGWLAPRAPGPAGWGSHSGARDPLVAAVVGRLGARNPRLARLERRGLAALLATDLVLAAAPPGLDPGELEVTVVLGDGEPGADVDFWRTACAHGGAHASPMLFASTLPSAVGGELAMTFGLTGPVLVVVADGDAAGLGGAGGLGGLGGLARGAGGAGTGPALDVCLLGWSGGATGSAVAWLRPAVAVAERKSWTRPGRLDNPPP
jgi:hypothetical protein